MQKTVFATRVMGIKLCALHLSNFHAINWLPRPLDTSEHKKNVGIGYEG